MEAIGLMAGGVAHDLNNILSGIVSYPELILMDLPENSPIREPIQTVQEAGKRAAEVVADLLTMARGVATVKKTLSLNSLISEYLNSPEHERLRRISPGIRFEVKLSEGLLNTTGSSIHLKKILMNLVINATEAIESGGTVTITTFNSSLDEVLKGYEDVKPGAYAVLSVADDGSGIAGEDLKRIFEPFYTKKVMGRSGTGLGLPVVWNTVQDHHGYIDVRSSGEGSVFEIYFPATRKPAIEDMKDFNLDQYQGHGEKILVVDDEAPQRKIARGMLTRLGYQADAVSSGEAAIEYVRYNPVDLILLDMVMPKGMNGRKTYAEILKISPNQKAVIASGYARTEEVSITQEMGAGAYVKKPYQLKEIAQALHEALSGK